MSADDRIAEPSRHALGAALDDLHRGLREFAERFALDSGGRPVPPLQAIRAQLSVISIAIAEMRPRALRGYGDLEREAAAAIDESCNRLEQDVRRAQQEAARAHS